MLSLRSARRRLVEHGKTQRLACLPLTGLEHLTYRPRVIMKHPRASHMLDNQSSLCSSLLIAHDCHKI
jgi:hypothetical protein